MKTCDHTGRPYLGLVALLLLLFAGQVAGQRGHIPPGLADRYVSENTFGIHFRYMPGVSYGLASMTFPFAKSDPRLVSDMMGVDIVFFFKGNRFQHHLRSSLSLPAYIYSDAVSEGGFYIDRYKSQYRRHQQVYYFNLPLWQTGFFSLRYGLTTSIQYENRIINFNSGRVDEKWNAGLALGPNMAAEVPLFKRLSLHGEGHFLCFLPYSSMGRFKTGYGSSTHFESTFHALTYAPYIDLQARIRLLEDLLVIAGYRNIFQMGYGSVNPSFVNEDMIAYSFDEIQEFYAGLRYTMPARWTRRKTVPSCPLQRP
jgi:hypothetical protein